MYWASYTHKNKSHRFHQYYNEIDIKAMVYFKFMITLLAEHHLSGSFLLSIDSKTCTWEAGKSIYWICIKHVNYLNRLLVKTIAFLNFLCSSKKSIPFKYVWSIRKSSSDNENSLQLFSAKSRLQGNRALPILSFLLAPWCAVRSNQPHLEERDPIWGDDWSHSPFIRWSPNWGFPGFSLAVRQMPGDLCTAPGIIILSPLSLVTDVTFGASGHWLGTRIGAGAIATLA